MSSQDPKPAHPEFAGAIPAALPDNESGRLAALLEYEILDSLPEQSYQDIVTLASQLCDVPIALIGLIDSKRQWYKASVGLDSTEVHRDLTFCGYALHQPHELMEVRDATQDPRFASHPFVVPEQGGIRFYAGMPLVTEEGYALGTLCAIDLKPRQLTSAQEQGLRALARQVMELLNLRRTLARLDEVHEVLAQSESRYRALVGNIPGFVFSAEAQRPWRIRYASVGVERLTGFTPQHFVGHPQGFEQVMVAEDVAATEAELSGQIAQDQPLRTEYRIRHRDGRELWVEGRAGRPYPAPDGTLLFDGLVTDIDAVHRARLAVEASEQRFRFLAQSVPEVIWTADANGRLDFVSDRALVQHGIEPARLLGEQWGDIVSASDREMMFTAWHRSVETGEPYDVQARLRGADGQFRWHQCRAIAQLGADARPMKWFGSCTDIEETLRARDQAEAAARARTTFLSTMSHEIRTPMNAVLGFAGLLADTPLNPQQREFLQAIRSSGDHLIVLINDILDYSKIESGGLKLQTAPFDVRRLVETALELVSHQAQAHNLELVTTVDADVPGTCDADASRIRQVLVNLLGNAVKFTPSGEVVARVSARALGSGLHEFQFEVRDTGIGISEEAQSRLFVEFEQAEASTSRRFGGTGLGLAISRRIVEAHGGRIEVESAPGRGSVFRVCLPARGGASPPETVSAALLGRRVLVVDDNAAQRATLDALLRAWRLQPTIEASAESALAAVQQGTRFELALIDQRMPEVDGTVLASRLRAVHEMPVVLMAALGAEPARREDYAAVLPKPIRRARLLSALSLALQAPAVETPALAATVPAVPTAPLRVLLVEDNFTNQKLARLLLRKLGYPNPDLAENGEQALAAMTGQPYDVVLMDVEMPGIDGIEATQRIRALGTAVHQPRIVAMTANVMPEDRERCAAAGMDDYVAKPITPEALAAALRRADRQRDTR